MNTEVTLEQRLEQLECKCRNLRRILAGVVMAGAAALLVAAAPNPAKEALQTSKLEVVDKEGRVRIRLGQADEGFGIVVYDSDGKFRATLTDAPLGSAMQLSKKGGSITLMAMEEGCGITIRDEGGKPRAVVVQQKGEAEILLKDKEGNTVFSAPK
jgi:hypothetical protein